MKKVKYIALILVLTLGLIGGAYAVWTDELVMAGSVETGNVNVEIVDSKLWIQPTTPPGLLGGSIGHDEKKVSVSMTNLYPGHPEYRIDFELENMGTIPVRFDTAAITFDPDDSPVIDYLEVVLEVAYFPGGGSTGDYIIYETAWFPLAELPGKLAPLQSVELEPGDVLKFGSTDRYGEPGCIRIRLHEDAGDDTQDESVEFILELVFRQWNL